jgi:uncharacterized lipoprotein YajG
MKNEKYYLRLLKWCDKHFVTYPSVSSLMMNPLFMTILVLRIVEGKDKREDKYLASTKR